jgi:NtrC-family two-component system sensor histidine kinase KinB
MYMPLNVSGTSTGVLAVRPVDPLRLRDPEQLHLLETFASLVASAIERTRLAAESRRVEHALELSRLRSEFVHTASHQLRAPLRSLALQLDALRDHIRALLDPEQARQLDAARAEAARLLALADDLFDLARLETGAIPLRLGEFSVREIVEPVISALRPVAANAQLHLSSEIPGGLPDVMADADRITTVVTNLVSNAIGHTPPGGTIIVSADDMGDFVQVSVADNGTGVPLEDQLGLFERFTKAGRQRDEGPGLGLAIARESVRAHGGMIWVDSGPGPGCVFSFTLPVAVPVEDEGTSTAMDRAPAARH